MMREFPLKRIVRLINTRGPRDPNLPFVGLEHIKGWTGEITLAEDAEAEGTVGFFSPNDILFGKLRPYLAKVALPDFAGTCSTEALILRPAQDQEPRFLRYALSTPEVIDRINGTTFGAKMPRASWEDIGRERIPTPDLATQRAIADFLDQETDRIDALMSKKAKFADLIIEREEASFLRAVTGKNESGDFLPSGVDWIGDLPEGWLAPKFVHVARLESGHTPSRKQPEYWIPEECVVPWVSLADVWQLRSGDTVYLEDTQEKVSEVGLANSSARILPRDTVVLSRTASVGFPGILAKPMATTQDFVGWIPSTRIRSKYLYYVLRAMKSEFRRLMIGSTHKTIYMPDIRGFRTPLPPVEKQDEIVQKLDATIDTYRKVHVRLLESIERLTELRASLITAAVTGQVDPDTYRRQGTTDRTLERIEQEMSA